MHIQISSTLIVNRKDSLRKSDNIMFYRKQDRCGVKLARIPQSEVSFRLRIRGVCWGTQQGTPKISAVLHRRMVDASGGGGEEFTSSPPPEEAVSILTLFISEICALLQRNIGISPIDKTVVSKNYFHGFEIGRVLRIRASLLARILRLVLF